MQTLSLLADGARYDLSARIDDLGNGPKADTESDCISATYTAYATPGSDTGVIPNGSDCPDGLKPPHRGS